MFNIKIKTMEKTKTVKLRTGEIGYVFPDGLKYKGREIVYFKDNPKKIIHAYRHNLTFLDGN